MATVHSFRTDSDWYGLEEERIYHDQEDCGFGRRLKRDHNDIVGVGVGRRLCQECARLAGDRGDERTRSG